MLPNPRRLSKNEMIEHLLYEIHMRATRHKRASNIKEYLLRDLEAIDADAQKLSEVIASPKKEYFL